MFWTHIHQKMVSKVSDQCFAVFYQTKHYYKSSGVSLIYGYSNAFIIRGSGISAPQNSFASFMLHITPSLANFSFTVSSFVRVLKRLVLVHRDALVWGLAAVIFSNQCWKAVLNLSTNHPLTLQASSGHSGLWFNNRGTFLTSLVISRFISWWKW